MKIGNKILPDAHFILKSILNPFKKRGYYIGWTGHGNLGDEALKIAIYTIFKDTAIMQDHYDGLILKLFRKFGFLKNHFLMLGGGTTINKNPGWFIHLTSWMSRKNIVFGTGVANPIFWKNINNFKDLREDWVKVLNTFDFIGVRGLISSRLLKEWGVEKEIKVIGDPVLFLTRPLYFVKKPSKTLGINFALPKGNLFWGQDHQRWLNNFISFVDAMLNDGWNIEFVPVSKEDLKDIIMVLGRFKSSQITVFNDYDSVHKTMNTLEEQDVFLGVRLHSVVLAYCSNTPGIMVEYRPKCKDFMNSIGMDELNIRIDQFDPKEAKKKVEYVYGNLKEFRIKGNKACVEYKNELIRQSKIVNEIIKIIRN
jgi:polysaccharide pyruvyl transferase WcaK-like protein